MAAIPSSLAGADRRSSSSNREGPRSFGRGGAGMYPESINTKSY
jgi:hypothetical protein